MYIYIYIYIYIYATITMCKLQDCRAAGWFFMLPSHGTEADLEFGFPQGGAGGVMLQRWDGLTTKNSVLDATLMAISYKYL